MKTILPAMALVAGLVGCTGKTESQKTTESAMIRETATQACWLIRDVLLKESAVFRDNMASNSEIIIWRTSLYRPAMEVGAAVRWGETFAPIEDWDKGVTPSARLNIANILSTSPELAWCIYKDSLTFPLFLSKEPTASERLAHQLNHPVNPFRTMPEN